MTDIRKECPVCSTELILQLDTGVCLKHSVGGLMHPRCPVCERDALRGVLKIIIGTAAASTDETIRLATIERICMGGGFKATPQTGGL